MIPKMAPYSACDTKSVPVEIICTCDCLTKQNKSTEGYSKFKFRKHDKFMRELSQY